MIFPVRPLPLVLLLALAPAALPQTDQGIENFHQVDQFVYRGAQPDSDGFALLAKMGVKTVVDLREADARAKQEEKLVKAAGMTFINIPMTGLKPPTDSQMDQVLGILENQGVGPVFVHCKRGADRTGAVIGAYRIDHDGWTNDRALAEAKALGMSPFQFPRASFIHEYRPRTLAAHAANPVSSPSNGTAAAAATAP